MKTCFDPCSFLWITFPGNVFISTLEFYSHFNKSCFIPLVSFFTKRYEIGQWMSSCFTNSSERALKLSEKKIGFILIHGYFTRYTFSWKSRNDLTRSLSNIFNFSALLIAGEKKVNCMSPTVPLKRAAFEIELVIKLSSNVKRWLNDISI